VETPTTGELTLTVRPRLANYENGFGASLLIPTTSDDPSRRLEPSSVTVNDGDGGRLEHARPVDIEFHGRHDAPVEAIDLKAHRWPIPKTIGAVGDHFDAGDQRSPMIEPSNRQLCRDAVRITPTDKNILPTSSIKMGSAESWTATTGGTDHKPGFGHAGHYERLCDSITYTNNHSEIHPAATEPFRLQSRW